MRARPSIDAPADKAQKRPFLGRFDARRTETRENVFDPQKREKKAPAKTHAQGLDIPPIPPGEPGELGESFAKPRKRWIRGLFSRGGISGGTISTGGIGFLARPFCAQEEYSIPSRLIAWEVQFWDRVP